VNVIVYAFAGVVKINEDWLRAEPLRHWLAKRAEYVLPLLLVVVLVVLVVLRRVLTLTYLCLGDL